MSKENGLAPLDAAVATTDADSRFVALASGDAGVAEAMQWNAVGGGFGPQDLIRVPMPAGGATTWTFQNGLGEEESTKEIVGILALFMPQIVLWPSEEPEIGRSPVIVSHDLRVGRRVSDDIGDLDEAVLEEARTGDREYDMTRLAYCQWGSGRDGNGRRAKESRLMAILRENDLMPLLVTASPGSIKAIDPFVRRMTSVGVPYFHAVVGLRLEKASNPAGQTYSRIVPRMVSRLSREAAARVRDSYTIPLMKAIKDGSSPSDSE